jgi:hypothetical protein
MILFNSKLSLRYFFCDRRGVPKRKLTSELIPFDTLNIFDSVAEQIFVNRLLSLYITVTDYRRLATIRTSLTTTHADQHSYKVS